MAIAKVIRKFESFEEMRLAHIQGWQELGTEAINEHAWQLVIDYRRRHDIRHHEPRMERRVTSVRRAWIEEDKANSDT
jgi:hypothetical protein